MVSHSKNQIANIGTYFAIADALSKVCKKDGQWAVYDKGHTDATVAKAVGAKKIAVVAVRKSQFGPLRGRGPGFASGKGTPMSTRLLDHRLRIEALEKQVALLADEVQRLRRLSSAATGWKPIADPNNPTLTNWPSQFVPG